MGDQGSLGSTGGVAEAANAKLAAVAPGSRVSREPPL